MPSGGTRYIAFNTTVKPFDNINVRKAIIAASDRNALRLTRGGEILGDIATGWIPPGIPGLRGGRRPEAEHRPGLPGEPERVTRRWPRSTCWPPSSRTRACRSTPTASGPAGRRSSPSPRTPTRARRPPRSSRARSRSSGSSSTSGSCPRTRSTRSSAACRKEKVAICPNVGWFKDFADPQSMLDADVQRQQHPRAGQRQLAAAQRARDQRRHEGRRGRARRARPQQGVGQDQPHDRRAGPGDPVDLGQDGPGRTPRTSTPWPTGTTRPTT